MIRAVIFDCFGVLVGEGWLPYKRLKFGHDKDLFDQATDLRKQVDLGMISTGEFIRQVAKLANTSEADVVTVIRKNPPNDALFDYIAKDLKPKYKIALLSNAGGDRLNELFTPEQLGLFDAISLSFETGVLKPDPRAYLQIAEKLGVRPEECVFVDDQDRYCVAATDTGMHAVCFETFEKARPELEKLLEK